MVTKDQIIEAMKTIEDPELFLDIWFLGLIYSIDITEEVINIDMTFTSAMCPAGPQLLNEVKTKTEAISEGIPVKVKVVFSPPWEPSEDVKLMLGLM